uniref:Uncharacterized protein n=1 Tax=Myoviridae sp. ctNQV2 TaxID=2827683 RepID=A0A8S5RZC7_9CAUD|nr:MAG TPA: hypothetical protein [Myoviridae sp. ctNQV2]
MPIVLAFCFISSLSIYKSIFNTMQIYELIMNKEKIF